MLRTGLGESGLEGTSAVRASCRSVPAFVASTAVEASRLCKARIVACTEGVAACVDFCRLLI